MLSSTPTLNTQHSILHPSTHQSAELLLYFGFDFSLEHHGSQGQIATNIQVGIVDCNFSCNTYPKGLEAEAQAVIVPRFVKITHLSLEFTFQTISKMFQTVPSIFSGL
jgi:hypothetical protein